MLVGTFWQHLFMNQQWKYIIEIYMISFSQIKICYFNLQSSQHFNLNYILTYMYPLNNNMLCHSWQWDWKIKQCLESQYGAIGFSINWRELWA
jgi:hypothetical protein